MIKILSGCKSAWIDSPLGPIFAIADDRKLYLLEFEGGKNLNPGLNIQRGRTPIIDLIENELLQYFEGSLQKFKTPLFLFGSPFQKMVWEELMRIPYGKTLSYVELASNIGRPKAFRAAANANGANQLAIIIPCHRVINSNGKLGGYGGGISKKEWLLSHEKRK